MIGKLYIHRIMFFQAHGSWFSNGQVLFILLYVYFFLFAHLKEEKFNISDALNLKVTRKKIGTQAHNFHFVCVKFS